MSRQINNIMKIFYYKYVTTTLPALALLALLLNGCAVKQPVQQPTYPAKKPSAHTTPSKRPSPAYPAPQVVQPQPVAPPQTAPTTTYTPKTGAGGALYSSAQGAIGRGDYQQAEMSLERALKIEPRNAHYWFTMAQVKYKQKQYSQTVHLCSKSKSLAGKNSQLISLNDDLSAKPANSSSTAYQFPARLLRQFYRAQLASFVFPYMLSGKTLPTDSMNMIG